MASQQQSQSKRERTAFNFMFAQDAHRASLVSITLPKISILAKPEPKPLASAIDLQRAARLKAASK